MAPQPVMSSVWKHFTKLTPVTAQCNICMKQLKTSGNTTNVKNHYDRFHNKDLIVQKDDSDDSLPEFETVLSPSFADSSKPAKTWVAFINSPHQENASDSSNHTNLVSYLTTLAEDTGFRNSPQPSTEIIIPSTSLTEAVSFKKPSIPPTIKVEASDEPPQKKMCNEENNNTKRNQHLDGEARPLSTGRQQRSDSGDDFRAISNKHQQHHDTDHDCRGISNMRQQHRDNGEDFRAISIQEGDELEAFGKSIVLQMHKLPEEYSIELMAEIQNLVTQKRRAYIESKRSPDKKRNRPLPSAKPACVLFPNYSRNANVEVIIPNELSVTAK